MTEEEMEQETITPEVLPESRFQVMIKEANLDESRANYLLQNFTNHFKEAAEWAKKAKDIIVTNDNQTVMMEMARTGRLFLAKKRQEIEKARKWMKEPALREGQAIDKIANLLKDTIIPTEEHLYRQENFTKLKKEAEEARLLAEVQAKMEADRIAKEEADRKALAVAQAENDKLQKQMAIERAEAIKQADIKQKAYWAEQEKIKKENEVKLAQERAEREKIESELRAKKQEEMKIESDKIRAEEKLKSSGDAHKLIEYRKKIKSLIDEFPEIKDKSLIRWASDAKSNLWLAHSHLNQVNEIEEEE